MALAEIASATPNPIPPAIVAAQQGIVDTFYQEVATGVITPNLSPAVNDSPELAEATTVITPSETVDGARHRANELYRTLFGEAAYNRQGMNSAIEVQLPENPP